MSQNDFGELEDPFAQQDSHGGNVKNLFNDQYSNNGSDIGEEIEDNFGDNKMPEINKPQSRQSRKSIPNSVQSKGGRSVKSRQLSSAGKLLPLSVN